MALSVMDRTVNVSWTGIHGTLLQSVRKAVLDAGREAVGTRNAKGDDGKDVDLERIPFRWNRSRICLWPLSARAVLPLGAPLAAASSRELGDEQH